MQNYADNFQHRMSDPNNQFTNVLIITNEENDLGVWIKSNLKPSQHISATVNKANQFMALLQGFLHI